jgi:tetratricopeptide (TPR) repeat protein
MAGGGPLVPHSVHSLIQSRLARLSEPAHRLLDTAVAVGRDFEFDLVAQASGLPEPSVLDAIDELRGSGLISARGDQRYSFDHSLTLEVAYREIDEARHRSLHRRVAQAIERQASGQLDDVAGLLAWHLAEAGDQREAAGYALRAARHAAGLAAWQEAIAFFKQALAGSLNGAEAGVLMELGAAYAHVGEAVLAAETYERVAAQARRQGDRHTLDAALLATSEIMMQQARYAEAIAIVRDVRERGHPGSAMRAELQWGVTLSVEGADLAGASQHLQLAEQRVDPASDPATLAHIVFELGSVRAQQGHLDAAIGLYERALELAERDPFATRLRILARNNLAYHKLLRGDADAELHARVGLQLAQDSGVLPLQSYLRSTLGEIALARGDLDAAEREFAEGLALAERLNIPERLVGLTANLGLVAARRGQDTLAVHRLSAAQVRADTLGIPHLAAQIRIWLAPLLPPAEAHAALAAARAIAESGHRQLLLDEIERLEAART